MSREAKEQHACLRKFVHPHFLSALLHVRHLSRRTDLKSKDQAVYCCKFCAGLHVGKRRSSFELREDAFEFIR
jgi:hypothetical protein